MIAVAFTATTVIAGCGSGGDSPKPGVATPPYAAAIPVAPAHYPVTVENCGTRLTFRHAPARVATNDVTTAEDMVALGLGHLVVGAFDLVDTEPTDEAERVPASYAAGLASLHEVATYDFTLELLEKIHADMVFAGWWNYGLEPNTPETQRNVARHGIQALALSESCAQVQPDKRGASITDTYRDLTNLGAIFGVEARARAVIAQMRRQVAAVHATVAKLRPVSVFLYESDPTDPVTALGLGTPTALIRLAGGSNVFASVKRTWTAVQWRDLADRKPECIVIDDYAQPTWRQKQKLIENYPLMRDVPAVRNGCFMHLSYDELAPGPRNGEAVEAIARGLHPRAFGLG